ncbi:hypothetical protein NO932_18000 [Pelagibacterium sp. 26DY04]|uniref:hypothetical protein n=1 Tax=Pelagibacterium sp. 26DY04 TaxID=2967130 RepID=UPI0028166143|nr:hypothetical protein [Pelagibacterium sp. 26DY04]WMT86769.1 hypothetical protein NO932_18000 [Pelagibacterium sp. 26DY04]
MGGQTQALLLLIGKLTYTWSNTESLLIDVMAYLMRVEKEVAIVTYLTLNTTRARLDLIERLAKLGGVNPADRDEILAMAAAMKAISKLRNKYSHSIFSFNESGDIDRTELLRIADFGSSVRYGKAEPIDSQEFQKLSEAIEKLVVTNRLIHDFLQTRNTAVA